MSAEGKHKPPPAKPSAKPSAKPGHPYRRAGEAPLRVVLFWHMHQPMYREAATGRYLLPWTYLHVLKDYVDMAAHLEAVPEAKAVVNFAPVLLEQIDDYARQVKAHLESAEPIADPLLMALADGGLPDDLIAREELIQACLRANEQRIIQRFKDYGRLVDLARFVEAKEGTVAYLSDQFLHDLVVWYHLGWMAETVRRGEPRVLRLQEKGREFTARDRAELLDLIGKLLGGVLGRYRALAERGQVELSMSPYGHPIVPLLLDMASAREALPEVELGQHVCYPGGEARARWHLERGLATFERFFGRRPRGCWPSEGAVSTATLDLLAEHGFQWAASGESVLRNSLGRQAGAPPSCMHRVYRVGQGGIAGFFRDDGLSDLIGFRYATWHADDAVADLLNHLDNIAKACADTPSPVASIVLDGENAWEYYPENGYYFLSALYKRLAGHTNLRLSTFSEVLAEGPRAAPLPQVVAGSWVYGTFSTWIGEPDKNRAWDMLVELKQAFDRVVAAGRLDAEALARAERQLGVCEGSDWFWWFGDYNPEQSVSDFDRLYRQNLTDAYHLLGLTPPAYLAERFAHGRGAPAMGGVMRPGQEHA
jgi:alpha-amylase/alpha-mannosidase (GH57 family)